MNLTKKTASIFLCVILSISSVLAFTACGKNNSNNNTLDSTSSAQKANVTVRYLNFKPEVADVYQKIAQEYEKETGVKVVVETAANNEYESTLTAKMSTKSAPTLFQINGPKGYSNWKEYCADLSGSELYKHLKDKSLAVTSSDGKVYGIPYVVEGYGIIYNNAIMKKYFDLKDKKSTLTSADQINNFAKLKEVTEDMSKHLKELGIEGVFASTSLANGEDWRWQTHLLNVPLYYEFAEKENGKDATLTGLAAKEIKFKYKDNFEKLFDLYINNSITKPTLLGSKSVADSMAEFALGKVAMIQNGNWAWSQISGVSGNTVKKDDIKMLPLYTGIDGEEKQGICIGTENYLAINKKVSKELQDQSLDFLYWLFSSDTGKRYVTEKLNFITPFTTFSQNEQPDDPLAKEIVRYMNDDSLNTVPWIFTSFPSEAYKKEVGSALLDYVQGDKKWADVEKSITEKWKSERA